MNRSYVLGFDEVGRGSLAGPVTVGLVALDQSFPLLTYQASKVRFDQAFQQFEFIRDSKHLSESKRNEAYSLIQQSPLQHIQYTTLSASNMLIDTFGIGLCLKHLLLVGFNLFKELSITSVLVDGTVYFPAETNDRLLRAIIEENELMLNLKLTKIIFPPASTVVINENKADDKYLSIAMASNVAKVTRDTYMKKLSKQYPVYNWDINKGYGTARHRSAIAQNPGNDLLRRTFIRNIVNL